MFGNAGISVQFPNTICYDGNLPIAYTDLNLASIVGAHQCLVLIRMYNDGTDTRWCKFRRNGDAINHTAAGVGFADVPINNQAYVVVPTDSAGIIEILGEAAEQMKMYVEAYCYV